jgi:hypothetical protein
MACIKACCYVRSLSRILQCYLKLQNYDNTQDIQTQKFPMVVKQPPNISNNNVQNGNGDGAGSNGNGNASGTGTAGSGTEGISPTALRLIHRVRDNIQNRSNTHQEESVRRGIAQGRSDQAAQATTAAIPGTTAATTSTNGHTITNGGSTNGNGIS